MNITKLKWISTLLTTVCIAVFEFIRHQFLHYISMDWGNLLVAVLAGILFFFCFHGAFSLLETLHDKLQKEKEETAVLHERYRIARELHDSVSQALFFMNIKIMEIETALHQQPLAAVHELKEAIKLTDADIRQHIFALQQVTPADINLVHSIQDYICAYEEQNSIPVHLTIEGDIHTTLSPNVKKQLLHIFKELLLNIRKHASATQVHVTLLADTQRFSMSICDNGKGFNVANLKVSNLSFGYKMLEKDLHDIGGTLKIQSSPSQGTTVLVYLDLK